MNIILIGYGKMGKIIEEIALERDHQIVERIDLNNAGVWDELDPDEVDVAIEFSQPEAAFGNIRKCLERGIPVISGTTGWVDRKPEIEALCREKKGTFFYASNFSIGVNLFFRLNTYLAGLMAEYDQYKVQMKEIHHSEKKDAPSGTAITLADSILKKINRIGRWERGKSDKPEILGIESFREGNVPGTHIIKYISEVDQIEIRHEAFSRKGFAMGAVMVAEWIPGHTGVLTMDDFLGF